MKAVLYQANDKCLVCRLVVTAAGFDSRLIHAAQTLVRLHESKVNDEQLQSQVPSLGKITVSPMSV